MEKQHPAPVPVPVDQRAKLRQQLLDNAGLCLETAKPLLGDRSTGELAAIAASLVTASADAVRAESLLRSRDLGEDLRRAVAGAEDLARADVEAAEAQRDRLAAYLFTLAVKIQASTEGITFAEVLTGILEAMIAPEVATDPRAAAQYDPIPFARCRALADQILTPKAST